MLQRSMLQGEEKTSTWSWGILKMLKGKEDRKKSIVTHWKASMKSPPKNLPAVAQVTSPPSENYLGTISPGTALLLKRSTQGRCSNAHHLGTCVLSWVFGLLLLLVMAGTGDRTRVLCMPGKHSITELHPQPICIHFKTCSDCSVASDITY